MPKNPRRLSGFEANLNRLERRKSKAWSGEGLGIVEDGVEGEGEGEGERRKSGPLDAEELKVLVVGKLRRVSFVQCFQGDAVHRMLMASISFSYHGFGRTGLNE